MNITVDEKKIKEIVKETIKEELLNFTIKLTPYVSDDEMHDVEKNLSNDDLTDDDFVDGTKWLGN